MRLQFFFSGTGPAHREVFVCFVPTAGFGFGNKTPGHFGGRNVLCVKVPNLFGNGLMGVLFSATHH